MSAIRLIMCTMLVAVSQAEPFIGNYLPVSIPGQAIAGALGPEGMDVVARSHGITVAKLQATIDQDKDDIWLTKTGKLVYACKGSDDHAHHHHHHHHRHLREEERSLASRQLIEQDYVPADAFHLHSRPGAPKVVYLDFNGEVVVAEVWVGNESSYFPPYDIDRNPGSFSDFELYNIIDIWQTVSDHFAPWEVDITTEEAEASCGLCVGIAQLSTFGNNSDIPSFVLSTRLSFPNVASHAAHMIGHSLGLLHDGTSYAPTFDGHGTGNNGWGPIMGTPFFQYVRQWSKGEYSGANNAQDDTAIILSKFSLRPSDHGTDTGSATLLTTTESWYAIVKTEGIISTAGQSDYFRIESLGGPIVVKVRPPSMYTLPSLYAQVQLRDADGNVLITSPPSSPTQGSMFESDQPAGTYYVSVMGIGFGDGILTGYTNYGSLGPYILDVTYMSIYPPFSLVIQTTSQAGRTDVNATLIAVAYYDAIRKEAVRTGVSLARGGTNPSSGLTNQMTIEEYASTQDGINGLADVFKNMITFFNQSGGVVCGSTISVVGQQGGSFLFQCNSGFLLDYLLNKFAEFLNGAIDTYINGGSVPCGSRIALTGVSPPHVFTCSGGPALFDISVTMDEFHKDTNPLMLDANFTRGKPTGMKSSGEYRLDRFVNVAANRTSYVKVNTILTFLAEGGSAELDGLGSYVAMSINELVAQGNIVCNSLVTIVGLIDPPTMQFGCHAQNSTASDGVASFSVPTLCCDPQPLPSLIITTTGLAPDTLNVVQLITATTTAINVTRQSPITPMEATNAGTKGTPALGYPTANDISVGNSSVVEVVVTGDIVDDRDALGDTFQDRIESYIINAGLRCGSTIQLRNSEDEDPFVVYQCAQQSRIPGLESITIGFYIEGQLARVPDEEGNEVPNEAESQQYNLLGSNLPSADRHEISQIRRRGKAMRISCVPAGWRVGDGTIAVSAMLIQVTPQSWSCGRMPPHWRGSVDSGQAIVVTASWSPHRGHVVVCHHVGVAWSVLVCLREDLRREVKRRERAAAQAKLQEEQRSQADARVAELETLNRRLAAQVEASTTESRSVSDKNRAALQTLRDGLADVERAVFERSQHGKKVIRSACEVVSDLQEEGGLGRGTPLPPGLVPRVMNSMYELSALLGQAGEVLGMGGLSPRPKSPPPGGSSGGAQYGRSHLLEGGEAHDMGAASEGGGPDIEKEHLRQEVEHLKSLLNTKAKREALQHELVPISIDAAELKVALSGSHAEAATLKGDVIMLQASLRCSLQDIQSLQTEMAEMKMWSTHQEQACKHYKSMICKLEQDKEELTNQVMQKEVEVGQYHQKVSTMEANITAQQQDLRDALRIVSSSSSSSFSRPHPTSASMPSFRVTSAPAAPMPSFRLASSQAPASLPTSLLASTPWGGPVAAGHPGGALYGCTGPSHVEGSAGLGWASHPLIHSTAHAATRATTYMNTSAPSTNLPMLSSAHAAGHAPTRSSTYADTDAYHHAPTHSLAHLDSHLGNMGPTRPSPESMPLRELHPNVAIPPPTTVNTCDTDRFHRSYKSKNLSETIPRDDHSEGQLAPHINSQEQLAPHRSYKNKNLGESLSQVDHSEGQLAPHINNQEQLAPHNNSHRHTPPPLPAQPAAVASLHTQNSPCTRQKVLEGQDLDSRSQISMGREEVSNSGEDYQIQRSSLSRRAKGRKVPDGQDGGLDDQTRRSFMSRSAVRQRNPEGVRGNVEERALVSDMHALDKEMADAEAKLHQVLRKFVR
eukprot:gene28159-31257_t